MFDKNLLKSEFVASGVSYEKAAEMLKMNKTTLSRKINGYTEWTLSEIQSFADAFGKETAIKIFFSE